MLDLYECRIQASLEAMSETLLLSLPLSDTWSIDTFLQEARVSGSWLQWGEHGSLVATVERGPLPCSAAARQPPRACAHAAARWRMR